MGARKFAEDDGVSGLTMLWLEDEPLHLDPERMAGFYVDLGEAQAQVAMARSMSALRRKLGRAAMHNANENWNSLARTARSIATIADPLGLSSLSAVARDVARTAEAEDHVALAATMARLERVSDRSFKMMSQMQHF